MKILQLNFSKEKLIITIVLMGCIFGGIYALMYTSSMYKAAEIYAVETLGIEAEIGELRGSILAPCCFYFRGNGADGKASLQIYFFGKNTNKKVSFILKQEIGIWRVEKN